MQGYRSILILFVTLLSFGVGHAQSFSEWFKQKKTQKKYLLAQIAALQLYIKGVEKGYAIAKSGLATIAAGKEGDFLQHSFYFSHLEMVSARVKNYSKVQAIAVFEDRSLWLRKRTLAEKNLSSLLSSKELAELIKTDRAAELEAGKDLDELKMLVTDGELKMTDDERIARIDQLYEEVKLKLAAIVNLARNVEVLISHREQQLKDIQALHKLLGL